MRRSSVGIQSFLVGALALMVLGLIARHEWQPDGFTDSATVAYSGMYVPLDPTNSTGGVYAATVDPPLDLPLRWFAYPGWVALVAAAVLVFVVARRKRWPIVTLVAVTGVAAAVIEDPGLRTAVGSVLLRLVVIGVPALLTLAARELLTRRAAAG